MYGLELDSCLRRNDRRESRNERKESRNDTSSCRAVRQIEGRRNGEENRELRIADFGLRKVERKRC